MDNEEGWSVVANKRPQSAEKPKPKGSRGSGGRTGGQKGRNNVTPKSHLSSTPTGKPKTPSGDKDRTGKSTPVKLESLSQESMTSPESTFGTPQKEEKNAEPEELAESLDALQISDTPAAPPPAIKAWTPGSKLVLKADEATEVKKILAPGVSAMEDAQMFRKRAQQYLLNPALSAERVVHRPDLVRGLINNNNACFRNVVIQSLLSLPPFVR